MFHLKILIRYRVRGFKLTRTWNLALSAEESVLKTAQFDYDPEESTFSHAVPEEKKVIFKFIDSNNVAILTKSTFGRPHLILYVVNGITGRVLDQRTQYDVDFSQKIALLFEENSVFVTYFNTKELQYEIWITELYLDKIESSFREVVEKYLFKTITHDSTHDDNDNYNFEDPGVIAFT